MHADDFSDLAREERDGTAPWQHRVSMADWYDQDKQDRFERAAERAATLRDASVSDQRRDQLVAAAHRQVRFAQPMPVWAWLGSLAGAALVGGSIWFVLAALIEVVA